MSDRAGGWLVIFTVITIGLGITAYGGISIATYHWDISHGEPVDATIIHSDVRYHSTDEAGTLNQELNVVFEYERDGFTEKGEHVYAGVGPATFPGIRSVESVADQYEEGETVTAYVVEDSSAYLVGEGPRYYVYWGIVAVGAWFTWAGVASLIYRAFGIDLPGRLRERDA